MTLDMRLKYNCDHIHVQNIKNLKQCRCFFFYFLPKLGNITHEFEIKMLNQLQCRSIFSVQRKKPIKLCLDIYAKREIE